MCFDDRQNNRIRVSPANKRLGALALSCAHLACLRVLERVKRRRLNITSACCRLRPTTSLRRSRHTSGCTAKMDLSLLSLPDDALLAVLAYLPPRDLFRCRVACRRLRDLCVHADLWRPVRLEDGGIIRAALRLVPCLAGIDVWCTSRDLELTASVLSTSSCVVNKLVIRVWDDASLAWATAIVERMCALGGLRSLHLKMQYEMPTEPLPPLMRMLYAMRQLRELHLYIDAWLFEAAWPGDGRAFLTTLKYEAVVAAENMLESLLATHAATLEEVDFGFSEVPVPLLAKLPRLRHLTYVPAKICIDHLPQLHALFPRLETLNLSDISEEPFFPPQLLDLLRKSSKLRSIALGLPAVNPVAPLVALGQSPSAPYIKSLELSCNSLDLVETVLPLFPSLQTLVANARPSDQFLQGISPKSAPSLTLLSIICGDHGSCHHASLHRPAILDLLTRNTALHLLPWSEHFKVPTSCDCEFCLLGCHAELKGRSWSDGKRPRFASHARRAGCFSDCTRI
ncbi:uncharacterized protein LOC117651854 [Thrips palmi]|uniref:Uncharacterized protein LOC117651854 n=1 Tax=Thrips palmi TaxID=161013 RepID=A0A6P9A2Z7_THRPL|nr:uncharacterized protein LOC117651854 [Thrips palmi]